MIFTPELQNLILRGCGQVNKMLQSIDVSIKFSLLAFKQN